MEKEIKINDRVQIIDKNNHYYGACGILKSVVLNPTTKEDWFVVCADVDGEYVGGPMKGLRYIESPEDIIDADQAKETVPLNEKVFEELAKELKQKPVLPQGPSMADFVVKVLEEQKNKFAKKNVEYKSSADELSNFTTGALLKYKDGSLPAKYDTLKDYLNKHIAKVYDHGIEHPVNDSWEDIIVYAAIALFMRYLWQKEQGYKE